MVKVVQAGTRLSFEEAVTKALREGYTEPLPFVYTSNSSIYVYQIMLMKRGATADAVV